MNASAFWHLIDHSRQQAHALNQTHPEALSTAFARLTTDDIIAFQNLFTQYFYQAYDWKLWAAAYIIDGDCSDDGFMDFRAWLIGQGENIYQNVLDHPDILADMIEAEDDLYELKSQNIGSVAVNVYQDKTGSEGIPDINTIDAPNKPRGNTWEEENLAELLPKLYQKFE